MSYKHNCLSYLENNIFCTLYVTCYKLPDQAWQELQCKYVNNENGLRCYEVE